VFAPGLAVRQLATGQRVLVPPALLYSSEQRGSRVACRLSAHVCVLSTTGDARARLARGAGAGSGDRLLGSPRLALDPVWVGINR
jgi:hypothetical protein